MNSTKTTNESLRKACYERISSIVNLKYLPQGVTISTMTFTCNFDVKFNIKNIKRYINISTDGIAGIKNGRTLLIEKKKRDRKKIKDKPIKKGQTKTKKEFDNQITILVKTESKKKKHLENEKKNEEVNVKLFKNGSIQMTGCISVGDFIDAIDKISAELTVVKAVVNSVTNKVTKKLFVDDPNKLGLEHIKDVNIELINSGCFLHEDRLQLDSKRFYELLIKQKIPHDFDYEPSNHSAVIIKYNYGQRKVSVFVFDSGYIMITGANDIRQIEKAYHYICRIIFENYSEVVKRSPSAVLKLLKAR